MDTTLESLEASYLFWDNVWKKNSASHTELNLLDVVQLSPTGGVIGWLFTASNGTVKSKLSTNWRLESILNRCNYLENECIAHHYNPIVKKWQYLANAESMSDAISFKSQSRSAIVLHPQLNRASTFMEVVCTKCAAREGRLEVPQYTNAWLCDLSSRGLKNKLESLPTQSITCKDKESNQLSRDYVSSIIKFLEATLRIKVTNIIVVVMFETTASRATTKAATNTGGANGIKNANATLTAANILSADSRVVRLHHIASITYRSTQVSTAPGLGDTHTVNSTMAESFGQSVVSKASSRVDCCHGDFCEYAAADESAEGASILGGIASSFELDDFGDLDFDVKQESLKAVNRHRVLEKGDPFLRMADEDDEGDGKSAEKMDLYPGQTDHIIAAQKERETQKIIEQSDFLSGGSSKSAIFTSSNESMRSKQASLLTTKSKRIAEQAKKTAKNLQVMAKSIALARQEMAEIEHRDIKHLNRDVSPTSKAYRGSTHSPKHSKRGESTSPTHGSGGGGGNSKVWPAALTRWWLSVGRNLPKNSLSVMVPSSSAHAISKVVLSKQTEKAELAAAQDPAFAGAKLAKNSSKKENKNIDENDNEPVEQANSLYFSWYYNPVRVCERCHKVYTELDRQRRVKFKHLMRQQRARADKNEDDTHKWREIEAKIFKQRQSMSRLAKPDLAHHQQLQAQHLSQNQSQYSQYQQQFSQYSMFDGIPGANSLAFDSVAEGPTAGGVAFGRAYKLNSLRGNQQGSSQPAAPLVPSKAIPPVPWGLAQEGRSEAYARNSNSILTRRILEKTPDLVQSNRRRVPGESLGQSQAHRNSGDSDTDAVLAQWRQLTRERPSQEEEMYEAERQRRARKVVKPAKKTTAFNPDRLLHPWQRDLNAMKNKIKNGEDPNAPDRRDPESQPDDDHLYGDSIDDGYEYDPSDPTNAANYYGSGGAGLQYMYEQDYPDEADDVEDAGTFGAIPSRSVHSAELAHRVDTELQNSAAQRTHAHSAGYNSKKKPASITTKTGKVLGAKNLPQGGVLPSLGEKATAPMKLHGSQSMPALVPRTGLEKLKSIDSAWSASRGSGNGDDIQERPTTSDHSNSSSAGRGHTTSANDASGAFGSPLVDKTKNAGVVNAVNRVNNALIGGMNQGFGTSMSSSFRLGTSESIPEHGEGLDDEDYESPRRSNVTHHSSVSPLRKVGVPPSGRSAQKKPKEESSDEGEEDDGDDEDEEIGWSPFTITA